MSGSAHSARSRRGGGPPLVYGYGIHRALSSHIKLSGNTSTSSIFFFPWLRVGSTMYVHITCAGMRPVGLRVREKSAHRAHQAPWPTSTHPNEHLYRVGARGEPALGTCADAKTNPTFACIDTDGRHRWKAPRATVSDGFGASGRRRQMVTPPERPPRP